MTGPERSPVVVCDGISRRYGTGSGAVVALDDVSATVTAGMRVAVTGGPSGSGKSTLLHLMAGLDIPTSGTVTRPVPAGSLGGVGVVFQGPSLIPDLDVAENVGFPLVLGTHGVAAHEVGGRVAVALERLGIADLADKLPEELSGGQAQRAAVARVLVARPAVILADEPTGQLDGETGQLVVSALLDAATELDAALVVATHDPRVTERLAEHWRMTDGRLQPGPHRPSVTTTRGVPG